jgi:thioesterase domain-containing protein
LQRHFGRKLSLATVLRSPTIREQAAALRCGSETLASLLVPIRLGGNKRPLYLMPPSDGGVLAYSELIRHLGRDRPLYVLSASGLDGETKPLSNIEEMAFTYLSAIRPVQPRGPYLLAGWSLGGVVAFEAAQQLLRGGQEVAGLVLIDAWAPHCPDLPPALDESRLMAMAPRGAQGWFRDLLARMRAQPGTDLRQRFDFALKAVAPPDGLDEAVAQLQRIACVYQAGMDALGQYSPQHFPGSLLVVRASERLTGALADPMLGWASLATKIETMIAQGNHYSMMREPQVKTLGGQLSEYFGGRP